MLSFKFLMIVCVAMAANGLSSPQTTKPTTATNRPTSKTTATTKTTTTKPTTATRPTSKTTATTKTTTTKPTTTTPHPHIDSSTLKWQGLLAVINPKNEAYCLTYQNLKADSKTIFAKCDNSSSAQQWVTAQLWNATDAPWNACLLNNINLCDSIDAQGQGILAVSNLEDKKQHWYYNWVSNQYKNGGMGSANKCSEVVLGSDKITPIGTIFKPCNSGKLQKWYFPYYNLPLPPWNNAKV